MRAQELLCRTKGKFRKTTDSVHGEWRYPNLIKHVSVTDLNQVWLADLTFVAVQSGFVYLACVLEAHSRRCLGWALSRESDIALTLSALDMALQRRPPPPGLDPP